MLKEDDENSNDEAEFVRKKFPRFEGAPLIMANIVSGTKDPFTCFVQHILAITVFGSNLPDSPPNAATDSKDMFADKTLLYKAAQGATKFKQELLMPRMIAISEIVANLWSESPAMMDLHSKLISNPELIVIPVHSELHFSVWSNAKADMEISLYPASFSAYVTAQETELIKMLHNVFHLERYVVAIIRDAVKINDTKGKTYCETWALLASADYASIDIQYWLGLGASDFIDCLASLLEAFEKSMELIKT